MPISGTPTLPPTKNSITAQNTKNTCIKQNTKKIEKHNKPKTNRRSLKQNKRAKKVSKEFVIYGNNCDRIGNKVETFNKVLSDLVPSVFILQETKRKESDPPLKASNLTNYQIFELKREKEKSDGGKGIEGGGIMIGALHDLNPVLTRQGDDNAECLSVEVAVDNQKILCVAGYGPQLGDTIERKSSFWKYLDEEAKSAKDRDVGLIIQMDTNSWVGSDLIPGDPNKLNSNGKLMRRFLEENPALSVINSLKSCDGTITRERKTIHGTERSVLDVFITCSKVLPLIKHMKIDHERKYGLSNFNSKKINGKITISDHHPFCFH